MKMGESSLITKPSFAAELYKAQCCLGKFQKEPEKNGKKEID